MQDGHHRSASTVFDDGHLRGGDLGLGQRPPLAIADPRALLLHRMLNIKEADRLAIVLKLVLHFASERQRFGARQVDTRIFQRLTVKDADWNQTAGLGVVLVAGPLQHRDRAQPSAVFLSGLVIWPGY